MLWSHWHRHITINLVKKHFNRERKPDFDDADHCQRLFQLNCWPGEVYVISEVLLITLLMGWVLHFFPQCYYKETIYFWLQSWYINFIFTVTSFMYFFYWYYLQVMVWEKEIKGMKKEKTKKKKAKGIQYTIFREIFIKIIVVSPMFFPILVLLV